MFPEMIHASITTVVTLVKESKLPPTERNTPPPPSSRPATNNKSNFLVSYKAISLAEYKITGVNSRNNVVSDVAGSE